MRLLGTTLCALLLSAGAVQAQDEGHVHKGFWIGFGLGGGINASSGLDGESKWGGAGYLRMGGTLRQQWLLGGEAIGWGRSSGDEYLGRGNLTFTVMFYPSKRGGLALKGGVGGSSVSVAESSGGVTTVRNENGFGSTLGVGYDLRLGSNIFLTGNVDWLFQAFDSDDPTFPGTNNIFMLTLGLTWH